MGQEEHTDHDTRPEHRSSLQSLLPARLARSLSAQLLVLTVAFVMLAEVFIYVPSIANYRETWLMDRINAAQLATLAVVAAAERGVMPDLEAELLKNAEVKAVALKRDNRRELLLASPMQDMIAARYDLRNASILALCYDAFEVLFFGGGRTVAVAGEPRFGGGEFIEIVIDDTPLRQDMIAFSGNILLLSIAISIFTAALVFLALNRALVQPMMRITANMVRFRQYPEDISRVMVPSDRRDEIGTAERELADMQGELRQALRQKTRLAALGTAVSKINHDLRNILASAQLISDRLAGVDDPQVQKLAPRLFTSIDRAIALATDTMKFGKAEEAPTRKQYVPLADLATEVVEAVLPVDETHIRADIRIDEEEQVYADADQLFRILLNLARNAVQAMEDADGAGTLTVACEMTEGGGRLVVADTGPGLPEDARDHMFEPFVGSARKGGTGLGMAIAADLVRAHGGRIELYETRPGRTVFHIYLPDPDGSIAPAATSAAAQ
ncbi:HAMP domain-containing sensor histidine kinase [Pyruvatibacter sp. HU-CL02332]|uniref:HAMP domain-containing sensor histidine kinase n=1 Tax=Pyruvatibacter sp. HU-CL02332 TaxID=3127650 RepID=UPI00310AB700